MLDLQERFHPATLHRLIRFHFQELEPFSVLELMKHL